MSAANVTELALEIEELRTLIALQAEAIEAAAVTSDNVWLMGRAFTVLTMVCSDRFHEREQLLCLLPQLTSSALCAASWVSFGNHQVTCANPITFLNTLIPVLQCLKLGL